MSHLSNSTRSRKGGNVNVVNSRKPGGRPMGNRNQGARRAITIDDLAEAEKEEEEITAPTQPLPHLLKGGES
tara:strand:+ start:355 stop:570 length:216 start_codon:yes stop_codon:yes gene_type:complete